MTDGHYRFQDLHRLFNPRTIALVGASDREHSIGNHALRNITEFSDFRGTLYPVNPKSSRINGLTCYPDIASLPETPDVMVVVIPASGVIDAVQQGADRGVPFAVILTSGFSEADEAGRAAEARLVEIARSSGMRIYGPNCPGLVNINNRLGLSFSPAFRNDLAPGPIGLATQGGGLGRNMLQNMVRGAGFALWSSSGNECDLQVADFIHYMADAPDVKVIGTLIEGIKDGARFAAAVRYAADKGKPVVGLKVGRSEYGRRAAQSHTASITGSAEVNSAVFGQLGVIEVDDIDELIDVAWLLSRKLPTGDETLAVFASSGGAASLCADTVGAAGLTLAEFTPETADRLACALPPYAGMANPIDTTSISISHPEAYAEALRAVVDDANVGLVVCPMPMDYGSYTGQTARILVEVAQSSAIPLCPIWMSERQGEGYEVLAAAGIMPFRSLRNMGKAVRRWLDWGKWNTSRDRSWKPAISGAAPDTHQETLRTLTEAEAKAELSAAGVATAAPRIATSPAQAAEIASEIDGLLAMKIASPDITHKSDIGGVELSVDPGAASAAYERILSAVSGARPEARLEGVLIEQMAQPGGAEVFVGIARDPVFGHVMTLGLGGVTVELLRDVTRRMLPVTPEMVHEMIAELRSAPLLTGYRGAPARDTEALATLVSRVSDFVLANADRIEEMDLNPVWVGQAGQGAFALDAVLVVKT